MIFVDIAVRSPQYKRIHDFTEECQGITEALSAQPIRGYFSRGIALGRFGFFDEGFLADDDDDAGIGDVEAAAVGFEVVADFSALGEANVAVNDGATNARVASDVYVVVDDGFGDFGIAVDANVVADDGSLHPAAGDYRTAGHDGIEGHAHAFRVCEDELCGGILGLPGA